MDFIDFEAEQSDDEQVEYDHRRKKPRKSVRPDSSEEEEDDDDEISREELKDLIDDAPIEESDTDSDGSDASGGRSKRKRSDDEDLEDDRLDDEDYDLLQENLGFKVGRRARFKRLRCIQDEDSDDEGVPEDSQGRDANDAYSEQYNEDEENHSDVDDFIVDDHGRSIGEKKKRKPISTDPALQEAQEIFGVDFDYDQFSKYDQDYDEEEDEGERCKKTTKKSIFEVYEPSELKRGFFTDVDNEIRNMDKPERMQIREVPLTPVPEDSAELDMEAAWIYNQAFCKPTVANMNANLTAEARERQKKGPQTVSKIRKALEFMRNQQLEVPFIAFYRKEYVHPELNINDLWKVYKFDGKWCQLKTRKDNLLALFEKMRSYQLDKLMKNPDAPIPDNVRLIKDSDIDGLRSVQTVEELQDIHNQFVMYYAQDLSPMHAAWRIKERERKKQHAARRKLSESEDGEPIPQEVDDDPEPKELKSANRSNPYVLFVKAGLNGLAKQFGLTPEQFAENLRDNYQRHEVEQELEQPQELAKKYLKAKFGSVDKVLQAVKHMVAIQIACEPLVRKCVREIFFERAKMTVTATEKGMKVIDDDHNCYSMKYLKDKPVRDLTGDQFLKLSLAEEEDLLTIKINEKFEGTTTNSYIDEIKQFYIRDEFSKNVRDWNALRTECVEMAMTKYILPDLRVELKRTLLAQSKEYVLKACCRKLYNWIKIAPYSVTFPDEDEDDWDTTEGIRVMGLAYVADYSQSAFACISAPDGEITDYVRLPHVLKRKNSFRPHEKNLKESDLMALKNFVSSKKPHVIAIGGESREALMIADDLKNIIKDLVKNEQFPSIKVEIVDNELAKVYANSNKAATDFRDYPEVLRQAISIARKIQDPLNEYSQLCNADEEILNLRFHALQEQIPKEELYEAVCLEFVNRTNEVGVDINLAVQLAHKSNLVQFICGLGPRKGHALLRLLKQTGQRLENRTQLVTTCHMGPKVFINCSGFIKIDTNSLGDTTEMYVDILDGSRVHPETYEWARKMAVDALDYDDDEESNPTEALEQILNAPERLKALDLDAFAEELERQGFGNKRITLYDIRTELSCRYKDLRTSFRSANPKELFDMLTKETPETLYIGKMVTATVNEIVRRKPQALQLERANPVRNDETGLWQCPFCLKKAFPELSDVWNHCDAGACPGQAIGVKLRLDNGISGFIHIKNISDKYVSNPEERVGINQLIDCRITSIDVERFSVVCTSKSSDLLDKNHKWSLPRDPYYDQKQEDADIRKEQEAKNNKTRRTYFKRIIDHPAFHNISYLEAEKRMAKMDQGEVIIRPSSKGVDHSTVTWKVADNIYQHIDVKEEGKADAWSLGKTLLIEDLKFEDFDEIIARHVTPMASSARDLLRFRNYRETKGGHRDRSEEIIMDEKKKNPSKINYIVSASKSCPGKFLLSYMPRNKIYHEFITVTPEGFRFRKRKFESVEWLFTWFKKHFRDPIQGEMTPGKPKASTPYQAATTMSGLNSMNLEAIQKTLPAVASQTPQYTYTPGGSYGAGAAAANHISTPYTPSGQTPFMTPCATPQTSQYGQQTPSPYSVPPPNVGVAAPSHHYMSGPFLHPDTSSYQQHHAVQQSSMIPNNQHARFYSGGRGYHGGDSLAYPGESPRSISSNNSHSSSRQHSSMNTENMDWQKAAEAWAARSKSGSEHTPKSG